MKKKKVQKRNYGLLFTLTVVALLAIILLVNLNKRLDSLFDDQSPVAELPTPSTIKPSVKPGWKKFGDKRIRFTFLYPPTWTATVSQQDGETDYDLTLSYKEGGQDYSVKFMREGRGAPASDSVVNDENTVNGRLVYRSVYMKNGAPTEEIVTMQDTGLISPYIAIDAQLPLKGLKYLSTIDDITASIQQVNK